MSYFDVAAGINQTGLNSTLTGFFASPIAQSKIFNGNVTQDIAPLGDVDLVYQVIDCPEINLAPPSQADWDASFKASEVTTLPSSNVLVLTLSQVAAQITYNQVPPLKAQGLIKGYASFELKDNVLSIKPLAVWIDESEFSGFDKVVVNGILIPQILKVITSTLASIPLPQLPDLGQQSFQPPIAGIIDSCALVIATVLGDTPAVDLNGYDNPSQDTYLRTNLRMVNNLLVSYVKGKSAKAEDQTGSDAWNAAGSIGATVDSISAGINGSTLQVSVSLGDISGYGELGGTGVGVTKAILCPIGAAADAIANPSDWDKVVSNFSISYKPDPLAVGISLKAQTKDKQQKLQVSVGDLDSVQVIASPKWSGSVTGTILATAAAGFVNMLSSIFSTLVTNKLLGDYAQGIDIYTIPEISTSVEGISVQLTIADGSVATPYGVSELIQSFSVQFPK
ncbi:TPA: hypothetical protein ACNUUR_000718 [Aeromonas salmonicida]